MAREAEKSSDCAFESALEAARVTQLVAGGVSHVYVGKDVTQEVFRNEDPRLSYFGEHAGPGPTVSRTVVTALLAESHGQVRDAELLGFGAFFDFWQWLWPWLVYLGLVMAMRHLSILEPLVVVPSHGR